MKGDIGLVPFNQFFPRQAETETRVLTTRRHASLPDDEDGMLESYCPDPKCHRRRVMLNVAARGQRAILASINFGFDRDDELAGPFLDPLNPQSAHAGALLKLVEQVLADPAYVARLEAHDYQVKGAAADPAHPVQALLARLASEESRAERRLRERLRGKQRGR